MYLILIIFGVLFIYLSNKRKKLQRQVDLFNQLLYIQKSPEKYIAEVDKLLLKPQSDNEKNINYIQKTTGLLYSGKFDEVVTILQEKVIKIPPNWQVVYYHNMLLSLYFKRDIEKANEILREVKDTIDIYYKKDFNKVTIELIYAVSDFYNNRITECKEFFMLLPEVSRNDYRIAIGYYFTSKILSLEGKNEESEEYLTKAHEHASFIEQVGR